MRKITFLFTLFIFICANIFAQNWTTDANTGLNDTNAVGTKDNVKLHLKTNDIIRGTINTSGYFGLGTQSPYYHMQIFNSSATDTRFALTNSGTGSGQYNGFHTGIDATGNASFLNYA